jgi:hypothetical protein
MPAALFDAALDFDVDVDARTARSREVREKAESYRSWPRQLKAPFFLLLFCVMRAWLYTVRFSFIAMRFPKNQDRSKFFSLSFDQAIWQDMHRARGGISAVS